MPKATTTTKKPVRTTWRHYRREIHGHLTKRAFLPAYVFAFPKERKEPITDGKHVRAALARFNQVEGVSVRERDVAFANILKAARYYGVHVNEKTWRELGK